MKNFHFLKSLHFQDKILHGRIEVKRPVPVVEIPFDRIEGIEPSDYEDIADGLYNTFVALERQFLEEQAANGNEKGS